VLGKAKQTSGDAFDALVAHRLAGTNTDPTGAPAVAKAAEASGSYDASFPVSEEEFQEQAASPDYQELPDHDADQDRNTLPKDQAWPSVHLRKDSPGSLSQPDHAYADDNTSETSETCQQEPGEADEDEIEETTALNPTADGAEADEDQHRPELEADVGEIESAVQMEKVETEVHTLKEQVGQLLETAGDRGGVDSNETAAGDPEMNPDIDHATLQAVAQQVHAIEKEIEVIAEGRRQDEAREMELKTEVEQIEKEIENFSVAQGYKSIDSDKDITLLDSDNEDLDDLDFKELPKQAPLPPVFPLLGTPATDTMFDPEDLPFDPQRPKTGLYALTPSDIAPFALTLSFLAAIVYVIN
ncbi:hypothetical protein HDU91_003824, partial [Kappamyces sp. JEL0680]